MFKKIILISCLSMFSFNFANAMNIPLYAAAGKCKSKKDKPYCYNMLEKEVECKAKKQKSQNHRDQAEKLFKQNNIKAANMEKQKIEQADKAHKDCMGF